MLLVSVAMVGSAQATDFFIGPSGCGSDQHTGKSQVCGSSDGPWATYAHINQVTSLIQPGDSVHYLSGRYDQQINLLVGGISHSQPGTVDCMSDKTCLITYSGNYQAVAVNSSHNLIGGFGHGFIIQSLTNNLPLQAYDTSVFDTTVSYNYFHNSSGGAIAFTGSDWTFILNNGICCSAQGAINQTSGVGVGYGVMKPFTPAADLVNVPYAGQYNTVVSGNYSYGNFACHQADTWLSGTAYSVHDTVFALDRNLGNYTWTAITANTGQIPSSESADWSRGKQVCPTAVTDGEGFIIDTNDWSNNTAGPVLVADNIAYGNGGPGFKCFRSGNVTFRNNTSVGNVQDTTAGARAEIAADSCENFMAYENIAFVAQDNPVSGMASSALSLANCSNCMMDGNVVLLDADVAYCTSLNSPGCGSHNLNADPDLANPVISMTARFSAARTTANFTPQAGSPAIGYGNNPAILQLATESGEFDAGAVQSKQPPQH